MSGVDCQISRPIQYVSLKAWYDKSGFVCS